MGTAFGAEAGFLTSSNLEGPFSRSPNLVYLPTQNNDLTLPLPVQNVTSINELLHAAVTYARIAAATMPKRAIPKTRSVRKTPKRI